MKLETRRILSKAVAVVTLFCMVTESTLATLLSLSNQPLFIGSSIPPQVMLTISKDQQLFKKAYNDYSDLDTPADGKLETTYKKTIKYYGYFDSTKCYDYTADVFVPAAGATDSEYYCVGANAAKWSGNFLNWVTMTRMDTVRKLLYGGYRIPALDNGAGTVLERAFLPQDAHSFAKYYTGQVNQDTGEVVDNDIHKLTPFAGIVHVPPSTDGQSSVTPPAGAPVASAVQIGTGLRTFITPIAGYKLGHQVRITATDGTASGQVLFGHIAPNGGLATDSIAGGGIGASTITVMIDSFTGTAGALFTATNWRIENMTMTGLSFCNTTLAGTVAPYGTTSGTAVLSGAGTGVAPVLGAANSRSQTNTNPPLMRVASGNYALWAANERYQCNYAEDATGAAEQTIIGGRRRNGNRSGFSGLYASWREPSRVAAPAGNGLGNVNYIVRVQACVTGKLGEERCKQYPSGIYKPIGLLQEYGDVDLIYFGLMTGSYTKNLSGGVLRKNVSPFSTGPSAEVDKAGDGNFITAANGGIVRTLDAVRIIGYEYRDGLYNNAYPNGDNCVFQLTNVTEGQCRSWASPVSEIYFEALRYFAGKTAPTAAYNADDTNATLPGGPGLTNLVTAPWPNTSTAVLNNNNYCSPLNILVFNASVSTNEDDGQVPTATTSMLDVNSAQTVVQLTKTVGDNETGADRVNNVAYGGPPAVTNQFFFGKAVGDTSANPGFELCSAKTPSANGLGDVIGICPEGPTLGGTFHVAGLAHHAKTTRIRPGTAALDTITVPLSDVKSLKVTTYGISLATNVPTLPIKVLGDANPRAIIQPIYRLVKTITGAEVGTPGIGGGSLVDMKLISQTVTATANKGSIYLNWEDSEQGGDYDQDVWGVLQWCMKLAGDTTVCPATQAAGTLTVTTQVIAESTGKPQGFGYVVSGTSKDGPHFHSGIENFHFCDTSNVYTTTQGNTNNATLTLSATSGAAVTATASVPVFATGSTCPLTPAPPANPPAIPFPCNDVGRYIDSGLGRGVITAVTSSTQATVSTVAPTGAAFAGTAFAANAWSLRPHVYNESEICTIPQPATTVGAGLHGGGCKNCNVLDPASTIVYTLSGNATARNLKDPLYYAAKYGGFTDTDGNNLPNLADEWDKRTSTGAQGSDGVPDNYFLVTNPLGLVAALDRAFISILSNASASSVATNSTSLQTGTTIYQARFNANDWSGQVLAFPVNTGTGQIEVDPLWDAGQIINSQDSSSAVAPGGTASSMATADIAAAGRTILTFNNVSKQGVALRWPESTAPTTNPTCAAPAAGSYGPNTLTASQVDALNTDKYGNVDTRGCRRLEWIRGDQQHEGATAASFRVRPVSRLGDIVNSDPNFVAQPNAGFGDSAYAQFRQDHINRPAMIYVGGNDGMLHAFRASDGRELLGYVPSKVYNKLSHLMDKTYTAALQHRYFVDASPEISDAFITKEGVDQWRTVLVSGLGSGAQGLFALDITDPTQFTETASATAGPTKVVLWEFNDTDDPNLGFIIGQPIIRRMANGKWAAIVSGGYNNARGTTAELPEVDCSGSSTALPLSAADIAAGCSRNTNNGRAYLYIIFLNGPDPSTKLWRHGTDYIRISSGSGLGNDNGLAQPLAADVNGDGVVDYVYAGDLYGNLHKFNVKNTDPMRWRDITNREILFTARDAGGTSQPITAKPEATLHPTGQGFIIAFGTGKYLETTDPCPPGGCPTFPTLPVYQRQSFYGIWDKDDDVTTSSQTVVSARNQLLEQTVENVTSGGNTFRVVSNLVPDWFTDPSTQSSPTKDLGWFMDFPSGTTTGERSVFRPILTSGRLIFTTLLPLTNACEFGGTSFLMVVDPTTGGRIEAAVLNVDNVSTLNDLDKVTDSTGVLQFASGVQSSIGITPTPTIIRSAGSSGTTQTSSSQILGTSGPLLAGAGFLLAYALAAGSSGGNASTMIGLSASGGRVSWRELLN